MVHGVRLHVKVVVVVGEVSKYILLAQNLVIYCLMGQMALGAWRKMRSAKTNVFRRLMRGILALSIGIILGTSSITVTLLGSGRLPNFGELVFTELFMFVFIYVWSVLNPRTLDER